MKKTNNIFGKTLEVTATEALSRLEAGISEGIVAPVSMMEEADGPNLYGRRLLRFHSSRLSALQGLVSTGLRGAALLPGAALPANREALAALQRNRLGTVVHLTTARAASTPAFRTGFFQLASSNPQEAIDFAILAHRISEEALIPGLHWLETQETEQAADFPDANTLRQFLGQPDDRIACPTPAQRMLFGESRRRLPDWFNFDLPALHGAQKESPASDLETAAGQQFFQIHLSRIIERVFAEFAELSGWRYQSVQTHRVNKADYLILTSGPIHLDVVKTVDRLQNEERARVACLRLNVLQPFPFDELAALLKGKKGITILEPLTESDKTSSLLYNQLRAMLGTMSRRTPELYYGQYGRQYTTETVEQAFRNMMKSRAGKKSFLLDIHFTREQTAAPTHEILLQQIRREYPEASARTLSATAGQTAPPKTTAGQSPLPPPLAIRQYRDQGPPYTRLSRFYNDTAYFYEEGRTEELTADPFQALPVVPPATANFAGLAASRETLPVFHPEKCTACGDCFVHCPHAALPTLALGAATLVKGAMQIAAGRGTPVSKLTPLVRRLDKIAAGVIKQKAKSIRKAGDFMPAVLEKLLQQAKTDDERLATLKQEVAVINEMISELPVSVTDVLFQQPEKQKPGSGELFSIAVDPHACTACGLCTEICPEDALSMTVQTSDLLTDTQTRYHLWEQLPDTAGDTIARLQQDAEYNPVAATFLSRNFYGAMNGATPATSGDPAKALLHIVTALAESVLQPRMNEQYKKIEKLTGDLARHINKILTKALPSNDFDGIAAALRKAESPRLPLDELIGNLDAEEHLDLLETRTIQRKIDLYNDLRELQQTLREGPTGTGRARYGLILVQEGLPWAEDFPFNSFTVPVLVQKGAEAAEEALGVLQGHFRHLLDNLRLLRRAQLEVKNKYEPDQHDAEIASLDWTDLTDDEKALIPPILLVGEQRQLAGGSLAALLSAGRPVKVVALQTGPDVRYPDTYAALNGGFPHTAIINRAAYVLQSSMADFRHLFDGLLRGLEHARPAVLQLFTVDDRVVDVTDRGWPASTQLAHRTRVAPLLRFDPDVEGAFISEAMDLKHNPTPEADWTTSQQTYREGEEEQTTSYAWTPADWLYTRRDWRDRFKPFRAEAGEPVFIPAYLDLAPRARNGKVPVMLAPGEAGLTRMQVAPEVVEVCRMARQNWNSLRELAGVRTPYPEQVKEETERTLKEKYEAEIAKQQAEYEEKLKQQEAELMQQVKVRLREKLLSLSRRPPASKV